jgi:DNA-directed RNA polymerase specialized sigma24 family protein
MAAASENNEALLRAMLVLMIDERETRRPDERLERTEVLLANAGLSAAQIAELTGKQASAIRMTLSRARKTPTKPANRDA